MPYADPEKQREYFRKYDAKRKGTPKRREQTKRKSAAWIARHFPTPESRREWMREQKRLDMMRHGPQRRATHKKYLAANPERLKGWKKQAHVRLMERDPDFYRRRYESDPELFKKRKRDTYPLQKEQIAKRGKVYREKNHDKIVARACARDAHKKAVTVGDVKAIESFYLHVRTAEEIACHYCGNSVPKDKRHVDHVKPLCRGGKHCLTNLVPACETCNLRKSRLTAEEFAERRLRDNPRGSDRAGGPKIDVAA